MNIQKSAKDLLGEYHDDDMRRQLRRKIALPDDLSDEFTLLTNKGGFIDEKVQAIVENGRQDLEFAMAEQGIMQFPKGAPRMKASRKDAVIEELITEEVSNDSVSDSDSDVESNLD